jgi:hypothetical protein
VVVVAAAVVVGAGVASNVMLAVVLRTLKVAWLYPVAEVSHDPYGTPLI